jgi:endonuclease YncB( thermonuclease family)
MPNARYGRTVAEVYLGQELVQLKQARAGMVWAYERYKSNCPHWNEVNQAFQQAKREKKGIFSRNAIEPWNWRKKS